MPIIGGDDAGGIGGSPSSRWPWMALLLAFPRRFVWRQPFCGGSLINSRYVLTAAHCLDNVKRTDLVVRLGEFDRSTYIDGSSSEYSVSRFIVPPNYKKGTYNHDLALLRLSREVRFSPAVCTIRLPSGPSGDLAGRTVTVAGWGSTRIGGPSSYVLQEVDITAIGADKCYRTYLKQFPALDSDSAFPGGFMQNKKLCATKEGKGACDGDSGGPLVERSRLRLFGIVSFKGGECGTSDLPTIYTRVSAYLTWIRRNANMLGNKAKTKHCKNMLTIKKGKLPSNLKVAVLPTKTKRHL